MIKRDNLLHIVLHPEADNQGGSAAGSVEIKKTYAANVSVSTTVAEVQNYGLKKQLSLQVVSNYKLPQGTYDRFVWNMKIFRITRQTPFGNEWTSMLIEEGDWSNVTI